MDLIAGLIESGRIIDIVLVVLAIEFVGLAWLYRSRGIGIPPYRVLVNIGAGGSLALALKASLTQPSWHWIAVWLMTGLVFHLLDLEARWQRPV